MEIIHGKVAFVPRGAHDPLVVYARYDMTYDSTRVYISLQNNNTAPLSDRDAWRIYFEAEVMTEEDVLAMMDRVLE